MMVCVCGMRCEERRARDEGASAARARANVNVNVCGGNIGCIVCDGWMLGWMCVWGKGC